MNPRIDEIEPSLIRAINARKRPGDIDLGLGEPVLAPDLAPFRDALEWTRHHGSPYSPNAGFPELREAIAAYLSGAAARGDGQVGGAEALGDRGASIRAGRDASSPSDAASGARRVVHGAWAQGPLTGANVCVTVGSEEAIYLAIKTVVDPARDEVLVVEPGYLAYPKICVLEGIRWRSVPLAAADGFRPSAAAVLEAVGPDTRLVVLNSPCNPTGRIWPAAELEALADGLPERVYVLSDEVYRELYFGAEPPVSMAWLHPRTLVAGSLSKSNALTGLRLGWLAGPADVMAAAIKVHQLLNTAASTFAQRVALAVFADPSGPTAHRPIYAAARESVLAAAADAGLRIIPPEGAFYAFLELPPALAADSVRAAESLLETQRVVTVPGRAFGAGGEGWLRLSWVTAGDLVAEGVRRIGEWIRS